MNNEQKKKLTFVTSAFIVIIIFLFLLRLGVKLFLEDFDLFKAF